MASSEMSPSAWLTKWVVRNVKSTRPVQRRICRTTAAAERAGGMTTGRALELGPAAQLVEEASEHPVELLGLLEIRQVRGAAEHGQLGGRQRRVDLTRHVH